MVHRLFRMDSSLSRGGAAGPGSGLDSGPDDSAGKNRKGTVERPEVSDLRQCSSASGVSSLAMVR